MADNEIFAPLTSWCAIFWCRTPPFQSMSRTGGSSPGPCKGFSWGSFDLAAVSRAMFQVAKQTGGPKGSFVKLVQLESDDFAVVVRYPSDSRLHQRYIGPDFYKAEAIFRAEVDKIVSEDEPTQSVR